MTDILFTPIIPISHENVWAQAYCAGNLMTLLVLKNAEEETDLTLAHKGKEMIRTLEAEFFSLEVKTLVTITKACDEALKDHENLVHCFIVGVTIDNVLYLYLYGDGQVILSRHGTIGTMTHEGDKKKTSMSGFLEQDDIILLAANEFFNAIPMSDVTAKLTPEGADNFGEDLLPQVHESNNPLACAALAVYHAPSGISGDNEEETIAATEKPIIIDVPEKQEVPQEHVEEVPAQHEATLHPSLKKTGTRHSQRLIITILVFIVIAFGTSLFFFMKHAKDQKQHDEFTQFVAPAEKTITDAEALMSVNPLIASQDITDAKKALIEVLPNFDKNSNEYIKTQELIQKADSLLSQSTTDAATTVTDNADPLLKLMTTKSGITAGTSDSTTLYFSDASGISSQNKKTNATKVLIKTGVIGSSVLSLQVYNGNIYVLTENGEILKFSGSSYTKSSYLGDTNLSNAKSMAIDSDIWIGYANGTLEKYTKGKKQNFTINGMAKPLSSADFIVTTVTGDTLYVIDKTTGTVTLINKSGTYTKTILSKQLKGTSAATLTSDGSLQFISSNQVYQLSVK